MYFVLFFTFVILFIIYLFNLFYFIFMGGGGVVLVSQY